MKLLSYQILESLKLENSRLLVFMFTLFFCAPHSPSSILFRLQFGCRPYLRFGGCNDTKQLEMKKEIEDPMIGLLF
jgi:hypothetical protein